VVVDVSVGYVVLSVRFDRLGQVLDRRGESPDLGDQAFPVDVVLELEYVG
jgi:hypothetical protein